MKRTRPPVPDIRSRSEREVAQLKAEAEAKAIDLRGQADADADRIRNEAQRLDPQFYAFLRKLEDYQRIMGDGKSTLLLHHVAHLASQGNDCLVVSGEESHAQVASRARHLGIPDDAVRFAAVK